MNKSHLIKYIPLILLLGCILPLTFFLTDLYNTKTLRMILNNVNEVLITRIILLRTEMTNALLNISSKEECDLELFSDLVMENRFIKDVGIMRENTIVCNAISGIKTKINLGEPTVNFVNNKHEKIWLQGNKYYWKNKNNFVMIDITYLFNDLKGVDFVYIYYKPKNLIFSTWYSNEIDKNQKQSISNSFKNLLNRNEHSSELDKYIYLINNTALPQLGIIAAKRYSWHEFFKANIIWYGFLSFIEGVLVAFLYLKIHQSLTSLGYALKKDIKNNKLYVVYQPLIDLKNNRIIGCEVLARWKFQSGEDISPNVFIPIAEKEGLTRDLTKLVIKKSLNELGEYLKISEHFYLSINFSASDLYDEELSNSFFQALKKFNIPLNRISIELSERQISDPSKQKGLSRLIESGALLSIDDFGIGVSNVAYLGKLSPDCIKIDKQFLDWSDGEGPTADLLLQLIQIGKSFGIKVVVEGVELKEQAERIKNFGADIGQGYLWHKPMPIDKLLFILKSQSS